MGQTNQITEIRTKIAGTNSGADAQLRQSALREIAGLEPKRRPRYLDLVPDPENEYDKDAIQVIVDLPSLGRIQLGFVKNSDTVCDFCRSQYGSFPRDSKCIKCGRNDHLRRDGVATKVCQEMRRDPDARFYAELIEVTGGSDGKANYGCNIAIRRVFDRKAL